MKINTLILTLAIGFQSLIGFSQDYYLHCGSILDVQSGKEIKNATIVISKNKITKIVRTSLTSLIIYLDLYKVSYSFLKI